MIQQFYLQSLPCIYVYVEDLYVVCNFVQHIREIDLHLEHHYHSIIPLAVMHFVSSNLLPFAVLY